MKDQEIIVTQDARDQRCEAQKHERNEKFLVLNIAIPQDSLDRTTERQQVSIYICPNCGVLFSPDVKGER